MKNRMSLSTKYNPEEIEGKCCFAGDRAGTLSAGGACIAEKKERSAIYRCALGIVFPGKSCQSYAGICACVGQ